ncbi:MAG: SPOR domain-containing protein [Saprospiraceae bacterium]|jgi:outer membrane lipoprotein-sorting protein|nr:SPOR domain-containing protein [Saprospiraceae bacterium]MBP9209101.1 SPOR domain-containing protein [Saprospiraceae bacterium]MBV6473668.1 hypothetical protein [Saprospiraceae bacterium]
MLKPGLAVMFFLALTIPVLSAQTQVTITEDEVVARVVEAFKRRNETLTHVMGWRMVIIATTDRRLMEQTKGKFQNHFPFKTKWEYKEPYYYLRAGAFASRNEASHALEQVKKKFPAAFLSMDKIAYDEM